MTAQYLSNTILSSADRQNARARNQKLKEEGTTAVERMGEINRKLTAAKMTLDLRKFHFDLTIKDTVERVDVMRKSSKDVRMKLQYLKLCHKADKVKAKYNTC